MQSELIKYIKLSQNGLEMPNPLELYLRKYIKNPENTYFHSRNDQVILNGIDFGQHGDTGVNGSKGSLKVFSNTGYRTILGHSHTPGIDKGAYQVGTSSYLQLDYNKGYSSWLHTHCIVYPNGKRSLINIIKGQWRL